jgi:hypothetical protein
MNQPFPFVQRRKFIEARDEVTVKEEVRQEEPPLFCNPHVLPHGPLTLGRNWKLAIPTVGDSIVVLREQANCLLGSVLAGSFCYEVEER